jgi:hypothetical protein
MCPLCVTNAVNDAALLAGGVVSTGGLAAALTVARRVIKRVARWRIRLDPPL